MAADVPRILSRTDCETIARRVFAFAAGGGETRVEIFSWWDGELSWALNRSALSSDRRDIRISIDRYLNGHPGSASTNQLDDASLAAAVRAAERSAGMTVDQPEYREPGVMPPAPMLDRPATAIWSDATFGLSTAERGRIAHAVMEPAESRGLLSFGYLEVRGGALARLSSKRPAGPYPPWDTPYVSWTQAQCSLTVRDASGDASGWAGLSASDWAAIDPAALGARALEKCLASRHPVAIEPGRYTVILEPQAVADLMEIVVGSMWRSPAESEQGPWALGPDQVLGIGRSKLGLKVADSRITVSYDPADPQLGILPESGAKPVVYIDHGVLTDLWDSHQYAISKLGADRYLGNAGLAFRMSGGTASIEDMIRGTARGLLVTRLTDVRVLDPNSLLSTGLTRDGLWLIEDGKISKPVKNFRFTESPLFVLNSVEQLGEPLRVFRPVASPYADQVPLTVAIVPPLKARDFSFTSLIDAI